ncbi:ATP-binding protein [Geomonas anaerohicana]|uniref:Uncharacterized protein n=1 Tax=Geomonas anaerohicana TaxID=2798583 RepID=A0ABS0YGU5_9BACT|nr:hypothetical protein [Geomonas anaerohicana]MBJ6751491.1 hypothetical protein [Geomonas anaerohicana]
MPWVHEIKAAEALLASANIPPSELIITSIKRVNPTRLCLPETEKERGYEVKNRLQNLLLENYGEVFKLLPHPCDAKVVLIKHTLLPSIDACHTHLDALSLKALDCVSKQDGAGATRGAAGETRHRRDEPAAHATSPREALARAERLLDEYDYPGAERELAALRMTKGGDLVAFTRGIRMLIEEMGGFQTAIDTLLAQPSRVLQEKCVRELLALAYYGSGQPGEAGALFDSLHHSDLGKDALCAYAAVALRDGNLAFAQQLLGWAEEKEGFVAGWDDLKTRIEEAAAVEAEPVLRDAIAALDQGNLERAAGLAREALVMGRNLPKARRILALSECCAVMTEVTGLWRTLERCRERRERLPVLKRLLQLDKSSESRIRELIQYEQDAERREMIEQKMQALRAALEEEKWAECFEAMRWLASREDAGESYRTAASLSPLFQVLYRNHRLERMPDRSAEAVWLDFVAAISLRRGGREREALQILARVRPCFRSSPYFQEQYQQALAAEQQAERDEVRRLLDLAQAEGSSFDDVAAIYSEMRRASTYLPQDERSGYLSTVDARAEELRPLRTAEDLLAEYETAKWIGDAARAAALADAIADAAAISEVDSKVAETLKVVATPVELTVSSSLPVDVAREHSAHLYFVTDRHVCLRTGDETLLFIDLKEMTAWSLQSPLFTAPFLQDYNSDKNLFLFRNGPDGEHFLRFVLDGERSRFLGIVEATADMWPGSQLQVSRLFLSRKEHEYFCVLCHSEKQEINRMFKFTLNNHRNPSAFLSLKGQSTMAIERVGTKPDEFVIVTDRGVMLCNKNLTWPLRFPFGESIYGVDQGTGKVYFTIEGAVAVCDFKTKSSYDTSVTGFVGGQFLQQEVLGISPDTEKMLLSFRDGQGTFYSLSNNMFSTQVRLSTIFCTAVPSRFYYIECDESYASIRLKDVTDEIDTLLQWKELMVAGEHSDSYVPKLKKLREGVDLVREAMTQ